MRALLIGVRDHLRTELDLTQDQCAVTDKGQPTALAGEYFIGVHQAQWQGNGSGESLTELFGVAVTISRRCGAIPDDRVGEEVFLKEDTGLYALAEKVRVKLHQQPKPIQAANLLIGDDREANGFREMLTFKGPQGPPQRQPSNWFWGKQKRGQSYSLTLTWDALTRCQTIESMT